jgi:hypothetical protein
MDSSDSSALWDLKYMQGSAVWAYKNVVSDLEALRPVMLDSMSRRPPVPTGL